MAQKLRTSRPATVTRAPCGPSMTRSSFHRPASRICVRARPAAAVSRRRTSGRLPRPRAARPAATAARTGGVMFGTRYSLNVRSRSYAGRKPQSRRARVSSTSSGHESTIACRRAVGREGDPGPGEGPANQLGELARARVERGHVVDASRQRLRRGVQQGEERGDRVGHRHERDARVLARRSRRRAGPGRRRGSSPARSRSCLRSAA